MPTAAVGNTAVRRKFFMTILSEIYTTQGRLNRLAYLKYMIILALVAGLSTFVMSSMATFLTGDPNGALVKMITLIWAVAAGAGNFMLMIRRLHDLNKSGWFALLAIVPVIGMIFSVYLFCAAGQVGWNQYGADPLEN